MANHREPGEIRKRATKRRVHHTQGVKQKAPKFLKIQNKTTHGRRPLLIAVISNRIDPLNLLFGGTWHNSVSEREVRSGLREGSAATQIATQEGVYDA